MCHHKHIVICSGGSGTHGRLRCASQQDEIRWDTLIREWTTSIPIAYQHIHTTGLVQAQSAFNKQRCKKPGEKNARDFPVLPDEDDTDGPNTADLEELLPAPKPFHIELPLDWLVCLQPLTCLPGDVILAYVSLFRNVYPHIHFPSLAFDLNHLETYQDIDVKRFFFPERGQKSQVVFCVNPGFHWIAIKIDTVKRYIATMCSMNDKLRTQATSIKKLISTKVPDSTQFRHFSVIVPHQGNAVDCGPLASMFMLFLAQNDITQDTTLAYDSTTTACAMRMRMFADLSQHKLTPLCQ